MGIVKKIISGQQTTTTTAPQPTVVSAEPVVQTVGTQEIKNGKVYGILNQPEIFVEYTGEETDTATTTVNNTTHKIKVDLKLDAIVIDGGVIT